MAQAPHPEPYRSKCIEMKLLTRAQADELVALQQHLAESMGLSAEFLDLAKQKNYLDAGQLESVRNALAKPGASGRQGRVLLKELGGFEILGKIGEGGMGAVYKARQKSLDRVVALKILPPRMAKDKVFVDRFKREARAAAALNHPNIVQGIDVGEDQGLNYFAMEFIDGETVLQRFKREGALPVKDVLEIGRQSALALAHAHSKGLIHRDIKPDNLMITTLGSNKKSLTVKVMDLGLARMVEDDASMTESGKVVGTPYYISPEQARGAKDLTPACDLYALGGTLLHIACGKPPYSGETSAVIMSKHLNDPPPNPKALKADIPDDLSAILRKLMAKKPEDRYPSAEALAGDLDLVIHGDRPKLVGGTKGANKSTGPVRPITSRQQQVTTGKKRPVSSPDEPDETAPRPKSAPVIWVVAGVAALAVIVGIVLAFSGKKEQPATQFAKTTEAKSEAKTEVKGPSIPDAETLARQKTERERAEKHKKLEEAFKAVQTLAQAEPENYEKLRRAWLDLRADGLDTEYEKRADEAVDALEKKRKAAAEKAVQDALNAARTDANGGHFDQALTTLSKVDPAILTPQAKESLEKARGEIESSAKAEGEKRLKAAADLADGGRRDDALKAYTDAAEFKYTPVAAEAKKKADVLKVLIDKAHADAEQAAGKGFAELFWRVGKLAADRKLEDAQNEIAKALLNEALAPRHEAIRNAAESLKGFDALAAAAARHLDAVGEKGVILPGSAAVYFKIENGRVTFKPTPDFPRTSSKGVEFVAPRDLAALAGFVDATTLKMVPKEELLALGGLLALLGYDAPAKALFERGKAELGEAFAAKAKAWEGYTSDLQPAGADGSAREAIDTLRARIAAGQWKEAKASLDLLASERLAASEEVKKNRKEIDELGGKIIDALIEAEAGGVQVQTFFKAKVRQISGTTYEFHYDFEDPNQLQDFAPVSGVWTIKDGKLYAAPPNESQLWLKWPFSGDTLDAAFEVESKSEMGCVLGPEMKAEPFGGYAFRFGRGNNQFAELMTAADKSLAKCRVKLNPNRPNGIAIARRGGGLMGQVVGANERLTYSDPKPLETAYVALDAVDTASYDNLRVVGKLDAEWLKARKFEAARKAYLEKNKSDFARAIQKNFKGRVSDAGNGQVRIAYVFDDKAVLEDFDRVLGAKLAVANSELTGAEGGAYVAFQKSRWKPPIKIDVVGKSKGELQIQAANCAKTSDVGQAYSEGVTFAIGREGQAKIYKHGQEVASKPYKLPETDVTISITYKEDTWVVAQEGKELVSWKDPQPDDVKVFNRIALQRTQDQTYREFTITGTLDLE